MSPEARSEPEEEFGSLNSCFVEGDTEQRARERRIRRRALFISIAAQSAILATLVLVPLFGRTDRIALANMVPIPSYYHSSEPTHRDSTPPPPRRHNITNLCALCPPRRIPLRIPEQENTTLPDPFGEMVPGEGRVNQQPRWGIDLGDNRHQPSPPVDLKPQTPKRIILTHLEPAMLIHRVEPIYPPLMRQIHREGRVELRAIIATDGGIESLQVVAGDVGFYQSALDAVRQWRYKPTVLNGQPVEIDTFIAVIYTMQH